MSKKVFIYSYSALNLGDDLFVKILCDRYPQHQFYMIASKQASKAFTGISNLKIIYSVPKLDSLMKKLSINYRFNESLSGYISTKCDVVIQIGGSIFIESKNWKKDFTYLKKLLTAKKPYFILGSNFGPYNDDNYYLEHKQLFTEIDDICFRDRYSYDLFCELPNTRLAPDVVFNLDNSFVDAPLKNKTIVLSVINLENRPILSEFTNSYEEKLGEVTKVLIENGYDVTFMAFCTKEGDHKSIERIKSKLPMSYQPSIKTHVYNGNMNESLSQLKGAKGIIATRFHSMILGWTFKVPVYPLVYSTKTFNVLKDTKFEEDFSWIKDIHKMDVNKVFNQVTSNVTHNIDKELEKAKLQFLKLDEMLK